MNKKVVLVTGAARGLGKEIIKYFAKNNYDVVINYCHSEEQAITLEQELTKYNINSLVIKADISKEDDVKNMFNIIMNQYGHIDVLINNASISMDNDIYDKTKEEFLKVMDVNVVGTFLMCKEASKYMNKGTIVNISSTDGIDTYNPLSMDYCASKAAIISLTKTLAMRFSNLNIYALAPNWIDTESVLEMNKEFLQSELQRIGQKELIKKELVAKKVFDLCHSNYESGTIIRMDGNDNE